MNNATHRVFVSRPGYHLDEEVGSSHHLGFVGLGQEDLIRLVRFSLSGRFDLFSR